MVTMFPNSQNVVATRQTFADFSKIASLRQTPSQPTIGTNMVPRVMKSGFKVKDGRIEEPLMLQSGENRHEIKSQVGEQRH